MDDRATTSNNPTQFTDVLQTTQATKLRQNPALSPFPDYTISLVSSISLIFKYISLDSQVIGISEECEVSDTSGTRRTLRGWSLPTCYFSGTSYVQNQGYPFQPLGIAKNLVQMMCDQPKKGYCHLDMGRNQPTVIARQHPKGQLGTRTIASTPSYENHLILNICSQKISQQINLVEY